MTDSTITRKQLKAAFKGSTHFNEEWRGFKKILNNKDMEECLQKSMVVFCSNNAFLFYQPLR